MSNQYPANYNPYMYGLPTSPSRRTMHNKRRSSRRRIRICRTGIRRIHMMQSGTASKSRPANGYQYGPNQYGPNQYGPNPYQQPGIYPINPNDPSQNPLYGHWDSYAIISFVFALFLPVPVIPAVMGAIAMWRTKNCI